MKKMYRLGTQISILTILLTIFLISIPILVYSEESTSIAENFRITEGIYWETDDLDQCVIDEFGLGYKVADWNDILVYADNIEEWANDLGMVYGDTCIVRRNGEDFYAGGNRHYFIARWDHNKPGYWAAHDNIDNHLISLGSWYNIHYHILAIASDPTLVILNGISSNQDELEGLINEKLNGWNKTQCEKYLRFSRESVDNMNETYLNGGSITADELFVLTSRFQVIKLIAGDQEISDICDNIMALIDDLEDIIGVEPIIF